MNRIVTFVITLPLFFLVSNAKAQKAAQLPRPVQNAEEIVYANERTSVMPGYRRYRKPSAGRPSVEKTSKTTAEFVRSTHAYREPKPTRQPRPRLTPFSQVQSTKAAPVVRGQSRRVTSLRVPTPAPATPTSAPDAIEPAQTQTDVVRTSMPTIGSSVGQAHASENAPVIPSSSRRITSAKTSIPAPVIADSSRRIKLTTPSVPAPAIPSSSRRIVKIEAPVPAPETQASAADATVAAETDSDIAKTKMPASGAPKFASPKYKYRSPSDYGQGDFQQSQWKPRPEQIQNPEEEVKLALPTERTSLPPLQTVDNNNLFEVVEQAFSSASIAESTSAKIVESIAITVPSVASKTAESESEEELPPTAFVVETATGPEAETENTVLKNSALNNIPLNIEKPIEVVTAAASAVAGLSTQAELVTKSNKVVQTSAAQEVRRQEARLQETSPQKTAAGAWWYVLPLLVVPVLVLLGWALLGGQRQRQYEEVAVIDIPRQKNSPWQKQEGDEDSELSCEVADEARSRGFHFADESLDEFRSETELKLLDEINEIGSIASDAQSSANSTSDSRAKAEK